MTQEHAKYEQEVIYGTTYDIYIYRNIYRNIEIKKIHIELVYVGLAHARPNKRLTISEWPTKILTTPS